VNTSTDWLREELEALTQSGLRRHRRNVTPLSGGRCDLNGRRLINFGSNDYLGLAGDPRLRAAVRAAIDEAGVGAGASALITGRTSWHERLEQRLIEFEEAESVLLFPSGYAANAGTVSALVERGDVVFSDALNHASLIDGCRLSRASVFVYPHNDVAFLRDQLEQHREARRRLIVTDGVFSMDGDIAPLKQLSQLAIELNAMLLIDEAHATGVLGANGRGACELMEVDGPHVIRVGTLSKSLGGLGGFVCGSHELAEYLWNRARSQVFSTALPSAMCAAAVAALDLVRDEPERRRHLTSLSEQLRILLRKGGCNVSVLDPTPIVPVVLGTADRTVQACEQLMESGFLVPAIRPPTVPEGKSRLRISLSASHSLNDVEQLAHALIRVVSDVG